MGVLPTRVRTVHRWNLQPKQFRDRDQNGLLAHARYTAPILHDHLPARRRLREDRRHHPPPCAEEDPGQHPAAETCDSGVGRYGEATDKLVHWTRTISKRGGEGGREEASSG